MLKYDKIQPYPQSDFQETLEFTHPPSRHGNHAEHGKLLIHLLQTDSFLALLNLADKMKSEAGTYRKLLLSEPCFFYLLFYKL